MSYEKKYLKYKYKYIELKNKIQNGSGFTKESLIPRIKKFISDFNLNITVDESARGSANPANIITISFNESNYILKILKTNQNPAKPTGKGQYLGYIQLLTRDKTKYNNLEIPVVKVPSYTLDKDNIKQHNTKLFTLDDNNHEHKVKNTQLLLDTIYQIYTYIQIINSPRAPYVVVADVVSTEVTEVADVVATEVDDVVATEVTNVADIAVVANDQNV